MAQVNSMEEWIKLNAKDRAPGTGTLPAVPRLTAPPLVKGGSADSFYGRTGGSGNGLSGQLPPPPKRTVPTLPQLQRNISPSMPQPALPKPKQAAPYRPAAPIRPQPKIPYNSMPTPVPVQRINEAVPLERRQQYAQRQADIERQRREAWAAYNAAMADLAKTDLKAHRDAIYDRAMMLSQGGQGSLPKTPEHIRQLYSQAQQADALTKTEALARGFENGFFLNLNNAESATGENLTRISQKENPLGFLAGNVAGTMVTQSKLYGVVNGMLGKVAPGAVQAAGSITDPILRKAAQVGLNLAGQQAADTIIRTPQVIIRGIQEGKAFADIAKDVGWQQTEDFLFNLAFVGLDEFAKHFFSGSASAAAADALDPAKSRYFQGVTSPEELHAAYRRQAKTLHPDMGGSDAAFIEMADEAKKVAQWLERSPAAPAKPPAGRAGPKSEPAYITDGIGENRPGIWRNADFDQPVTVMGYAGSYGGRDYVRIAQSRAAVPLDEISLLPLGPQYAAGRAVRTPQEGVSGLSNDNGRAAGQTPTGPRWPDAPGYNAQTVQLKGQAQEFHKAAQRKQLELMGGLTQALKGLDAQLVSGGAKSVESMVEKVLRKQGPAEGYGLASMKDHSRAAVLLKGFEDVPAAIEALKKRFPQITGEAFLDVPLNNTGYRGIHLTVHMGNGVNAEIQISTPQAWAIKKQTDAIYDKWRNVSEKSMTKKELMEKALDYAASAQLWENYYAGITPEVKRIASSLVTGLESSQSPNIPSKGTHSPLTNSTVISSDVGYASNLPLSVIPNRTSIHTPPNAQSTPGTPGYPATSSIARPDGNSNSRGPFGSNTVGAAESVYSVRRDARMNARQAVKEGMADGHDLDALIAAEQDVARYEKEIALYNQKQAHAEARLLQRARKADREDRTALLNLARKMNKLKTSPENRALIDAVLDGVDTTSKGIRDSTVAKLVELRETYSKAQLDPDFLPVKDIENKLTRLENTKINDLEIEDVRDMLDVLKGIRHRVETQKQLIGKERARKVHDAAQWVISEVKASKGSREKITGMKKSVKTLYTVEALRPKTFFERLGGWEDGETTGLYRDLEAGQTKMVRFQMEATKKFQPFVSEHRKLMERWSGPKARLIDTGILAPNGMRLMITPAQRISLYLHSLNPSNMRHIVNGGITAPHPLLYHKGNLADAYGRGTTIKLTPSQVKMITDGMTAEEKKFADLAHGFFNEDSKKAINETSLLLDGYEKAGVRDYFPIHSNQNFVSGNIEGLVRDGTIEGMGMLKERRESSTPIALEDVTNVLMRQIDNVSKYYGLAIPIRNFGAVYKAVTPGFGESVKNAITQKWGKEATAYIDNLLTDLQGGRIQRSGVFSRGLSKARSNFAQAVLSVNPGVTMKQAASYPTAAATLGWRALLEGLANGKVDHDLIDRYTPLLWNRRQGMSTVELGDMAKSRSWAQKAPALMGWIQAADVMTVGRIWKASEAYVKNHYKDLEPGSDAFYKQVARWFDRAVLDTQPNYTPLQRPDLLRSDNELVKAVTMFQTQRMQNYNMMYEAAAKLEDAVRSGNKEKIKAAGREFSRITSALVVAGLTLSLMNLANYTVQGRLQNYEDKDGNLSPGSVAGGLGKDFTAAMAGNLPFGNELYNLLNSSFTEDKWYGVEVPQVAAISDFAGNLAELSKAIGEAKGIAGDLLENGEGRMAIPKSVNTLAGPMRKTALSVATLCGVPASNVEKYLVGMLGNFFPEFKARYDNNFYPKTLQNARNHAERSVALDNRVKLPDEAKEEVLRLGVYPAENKTYFTLDGERYDLSPSQQVQYDRVYDQTVTETLDALVKNKQFLRLDDENREKILRNLFEYATALSRESVSSYSLPKEFQKVRDAKALGIQPWKYMLIKNAISGIKEPLQQSMIILEYPGLIDMQKKWLGDNLINYGFFIPQEKDVDYSSRESVIITSMSEAAQRHWPEVKDKLTAEKYQKYYGILTQTGKKKETKLKEAVAAGMTKSGAEWLWKIINSK